MDIFIILIIVFCSIFFIDAILAIYKWYLQNKIEKQKELKKRLERNKELQDKKEYFDIFLN